MPRGGSFIAYYCGKINFWGFIFGSFPFLVIFAASIFYINMSLKNKKMHIFCFSFIFFVLIFFIGHKVDDYRIEKNKNYIINIGNIINDYKLNNNIEELTENDIVNINLPEDIKIEIINENYRLYFKDVKYDSETKKAYLYLGN